VKPQILIAGVVHSGYSSHALGVGTSDQSLSNILKIDWSFSQALLSQCEATNINSSQKDNAAETYTGTRASFINSHTQNFASPTQSLAFQKKNNSQNTGENIA
jgi:hypothetical protein